MSEHSEETPQGAGTPEPSTDATFEHDDALVEEMDEESFPGSDAPSTWAGPDRPAPELP